MQGLDMHTRNHGVVIGDLELAATDLEGLEHVLPVAGSSVKSLVELG
jgi:hypothetical protein